MIERLIVLSLIVFPVTAWLVVLVLLRSLVQEVGMLRASVESLELLIIDDDDDPDGDEFPVAEADNIVPFLAPQRAA